MTIEYNLKQLYSIYIQAIKNHEPTLVFEIRQGRGIFSFLMFFSEEDVESKDKLFLYLRNTNTFIYLKLYGSHRNGDFKVYLSDEIQEKIIMELQLGNGVEKFSFTHFLEQLSALIPQNLTLQDKLKQIREIWPSVKDHLKETVDQADKTILIGTKHLPDNQSPQDRTLRKLYMYTDSDSTTIQQLIRALKEKNITLSWTNDFTRKSVGLTELLSKI